MARIEDNRWIIEKEEITKEIKTFIDKDLNYVSINCIK